jgi:hypothetical protein
MQLVLMLSASYCDQILGVSFTNIKNIKITGYRVNGLTGYCYRLAYVIRYGQAQSDPIMRLLLFFKKYYLV